ncbi:uncharacterized protein LOC124252974 [Haliotis rubra]|uniref:uncharacterized protein LOC124252974 n=1 Tax=Haliotis rubra TaxID=36100 RepID=UPI001EE62FD7|nr:uncharacterized protein LOC124252974 [Haliotis rubra]XP_046542640.1 uncharacterized protein LOC124252974 [Haliotis rubra]
MRLSVIVLIVFCVACNATELEHKLQEFVQGHVLAGLPQQERVLLAQLVATAEKNELKEFLDLVGPLPLLQLISDLPVRHIHNLTRYLSQALIAEASNIPPALLHWNPLFGMLGIHVN